MTSPFEYPKMVEAPSLNDVIRWLSSIEMIASDETDRIPEDFASARRSSASALLRRCDIPRTNALPPTIPSRRMSAEPVDGPYHPTFAPIAMRQAAAV